MQWICRHFRTNPIVTVELGGIAPHTNGLPAMPYRVALKDGGQMAGLLPMKYDECSQAWFGVEGLDWHLRPPTQ
jgi:hypothetical protein